MGCILQMNRTSILGVNGKKIQANALELLDNGYCDVICTDTHRASGNRIEQLSDVYSFVSKRIGHGNADILFYENPKLLLSNKEILNIEVEKKRNFLVLWEIEMARKKRNQFDVDEIYRGLRTNIEFSQMDDAIQVINVVSTIPNEGKSIVAYNLARIMAAKYKNVLLIDCDLRNASVHKILGISNRSGLTNIISEFRDGVSIHSFEGVQDVQYDSGYPLSVITVGHKVPNPSEVLGSKRLAKFLNQARQEFGYIIIDCPPVAVASDAIPLCNVSDGVLYVVDSKTSDKRKVKAAINDVERNGGHVMGVVLNKVESASDSNYGYGYGYGYGGEDNGKRRKRNSFIILASTLLLTGCGNSELEITQNDILEVARDDANATKKECSNVSIQEEKKYYTVSFDTTTGSYEYKIGKDGIIQERIIKKAIVKKFLQLHL